MSADIHRVGLTGNIASGKSAVARVWQRLGAPVIDADELARRAVAPGTTGLAAIRRTFGEDVIAADGSLDRARMRDIAFADADRRAALERIVHPEVARLREAEEAVLARAGERIVVHMIPLLFETGLDASVDTVVVVDAPAAERRARIVQSRGLEEEEANRMMAAQMPAAEKRARADLVIENDGTLAELERKAEAAWRSISHHAAA
jgi:dephospho-CoA kinase